MNKIILDLCGGTAEWSKPYSEAGYDVRVIDIDNGQDVRTYIPQRNVHGILAAPPCQAFAGSGAQYWKRKDKNGETLKGLSIVDACLRIVMVAKPKWWALENPVGRLSRFLGPPRMYFNPCDFGDPWTKKTCLWGEFSEPRRNPVEPVRCCSQGSWIMKLGGKSERTKRLRSITPAGFARAFFEANP